jgi:hypothetical protein
MTKEIQRELIRAAKALLDTYELTGDHVHTVPARTDRTPIDCNACKLAAALTRAG